MRWMTIALLLVTLFGVSIAAADNFTELTNNSKKYYEQKRYYKAIEELEWAKKELNNLHFEKLKGYLPVNVTGYAHTDSGQDVVGIKGLERTYRQDDSGNDVTINIMSGSSAGGTAGLGAFMNFANWANTMDPQSSMVMVKGLKGSMRYDSDSQEATLTFSLPQNVVVTITSNGFPNGDEAKKFAELINFEGLQKEYE